MAVSLKKNPPLWLLPCRGKGAYVPQWTLNELCQWEATLDSSYQTEQVMGEESEKTQSSNLSW